MSTWSRREFLAATGLVVAGSGAAWGSRPVDRLRAETYFTWTELRPGVHAAADLSLGGNVMVVTSGEAALLVDTKFPAYGAALAREASAFGAPISMVVNTHHHGDHTGGNGPLADLPILAHTNAGPRIRGQLETYVRAAQGGPRQVDRSRDAADAVMAEAQLAAEASTGWSGDDIAPDRLVTGQADEIEIGKTRVVLHHFGPGHTDNDLILHLPDANVLHTGDVCFNGLHPFFDPNGGVDCRGWAKVVSKVIELCDGDTVVVPGHGELTDREGLRAQQLYLEAIWDRVAAEVRAGKTRDEIVTMRWDFMDGLGFEQIRERAIGAVYDQVTEEE